MIWFIERPDRFVAERRAVAALAGEVDWLPEYGFVLDGRDRLLLRFTVTVGGAPLSLELRYPPFYPDVAPSVVPLDPGLRLRDHQWAEGSLCLEHRGDNWRPEITAADMIRSARTLLNADLGGGEQGAQALPAVHDLTLGQLLRGVVFRHLCSTDLFGMLRGTAPSVPVRATMRYQRQAEALISWIDTVETAEGSWRQPGFPDIGHRIHGVVLWKPDPDEAARSLELTDVALPRTLAAEAATKGEEEARFVLVASEGYARLAWRIHDDDDELLGVLAVNVGGSGSERAATYPNTLQGKRVAVVGCGSAGSKIAATLARARVGGFGLVDDDLLMRHNLVRNELDWNGVGEHKVHALGARLRLINPDVSVVGRPVRLVGQEAGSTIEAALEALASCDLLVDATANADAFNLLSAVATRSGLPLVWFEVFEGGVGGMVARHRPGLDPTPTDMRSLYLNWCRDWNTPWGGVREGDYASRDGEGRILVADDAEVGVVAMHAARFALDALVGGDVFPNSMYVIGLRPGWIFNQPFAVHPIDMPAAAAQEPTALAEDVLADAVGFLDELLAARDAEDRPA